MKYIVTYGIVASKLRMNGDFSHAHFKRRHENGELSIELGATGDMLLQYTEAEYNQEWYDNAEEITQELVDNDIRAAGDAGTHFKLDLYDSAFGSDVMYTWAAGPGHGDANAKRFAHNGFVDKALADKDGLGASCYGYGQTKAQQQSSCAGICVSISDNAKWSDSRIVHFHWYTFLGLPGTRRLRCVYRKVDDVWVLDIGDPETCELFLARTRLNTFVQNEEDLQHILDKFSPDGTTGVARVFIGTRSHFETLMCVDKDADGVEHWPNIEQMVRHFENTLYVDSRFKITLFGREVKPKNTISDLVEHPHTFEVGHIENLTAAQVLIGFRKNKSERYEPDDAIFNRPIMVIGNSFENCRAVSYDFKAYSGKRAGFVVRNTSEGDKWRMLRVLYDQTLACKIQSNGRVDRSGRRRLGRDLVIIILLRAARVCTTTKTKVLSRNVVPICDAVDAALSGEAKCHLESLWEQREDVDCSLDESKAQWYGHCVNPLRKEVKRKRKNTRARSAYTQPETPLVRDSGPPPQEPPPQQPQEPPREQQVTLPKLWNNRGTAKQDHTIEEEGDVSDSEQSPRQKAKRQKIRSKPTRIVSSENMGTLYLVTLESGDWRTDDGHVIYKQGITTDDYVDKYIQKSYSTKHPTKHMRHVRSWSGVPEVRKVEQYILRAVQEDHHMQQFNAVGTTTSEFIFMDMACPSEQRLPTSEQRLRTEWRICEWFQINIELALRHILQQPTLALSTYNIRVDDHLRLYPQDCLENMKLQEYYSESLHE